MSETLLKIEEVIFPDVLAGLQQALGCPPFALVGLALPSLDGVGLEKVAQVALRADEFVQFSSYSRAKRQREWLGGRVATKLAVQRLRGGRDEAFLQGLAITPAPDGRPLLGGTSSGFTAHLSISHSGDWAMGMAAESACGVDVQALNESVVRVRERFSSPGEEDILVAGAGDLGLKSRLTMLWAAKEAIRKMVQRSPLLAFHEMMLVGITGAGQAENPYLVNFELDQGTAGAVKRVQAAAVELADGAMLAVTCLTEK